MWKWLLLTLVSISQLAALGVMFVLPSVVTEYRSVKWDRWHDTARQVLVHTPTIQAIVSLAMISKARQQGQRIPLIAYWSCIQACVLTTILWVMIYTLVFPNVGVESRGIEWK